MNFKINELAWEKMNDLLPAVVQDATSNEILMLGYMNQTALQKTIETKWITFFSRSKNKEWMKGETSGNKLALVSIQTDCDKDSLLIKVNPINTTCHNGTFSCFTDSEFSFIRELELIIQNRKEFPTPNSYTSELFAAGVSRMAQKIGEEGVEVALAAIEKENDAIKNEVADLFFHILILLRERNINFAEIIQLLKNRNGKNAGSSVRSP